MNKKRFIVSIVTGALLGVVCIIGAKSRYNGDLSNVYLFAFWFNRLLMGIIIGLLLPAKDIRFGLLRGAILGLIISFGFYSATEYNDLIGFLVGAVYGVIIELVALKIK